jgi:uncharacterized membrane protein YczE
MSFTISKGAKKLTIGLLTGGLILFLVGLFMDMSHDDAHTGTRLMTNLLTNSFYFFAVGLGALFFLALLYATETGWYAVVKKIIEAVAGFLPWGAALLGIVLLIITFMDGAHIYSWMDPEVVKYDPIIDGKSGYLNKWFFWIRTIVYFAIYMAYFIGFKKRSKLEDEIGGTEIHFKNYKKGAGFLVFFAVFSSTSAWDWLMSIDVHWFSTLFGWYVFAGIWCATMVVLVLLASYLKNNGYLTKINDSHIHDLGKWTFATSFLWSYLWFSQFMLYWYANIGEEVIYFQTRLYDHTFLYMGMFLINFILPMVLLMSREAKRNPGILAFVGLLIFFGHWVDFYLIISIAPMGKHIQLSFLEIGMFLMFLGIFIHVILKNLTKGPIMPVNHPFLDESLHHHI